ncbi:hypothetical protein SPRG_10867 [Saprolegnia parasitica CBS 223.65]|uniref:Uncharacterized protein n=1 Tax=Saprolegnia parasitica (strain CBS 223.65) TaxID=695850 RepID=A0A067C4L0_SAPPC|nr:hypothetical protein SPRG_10867 [Saprolegnia parasitica CBS 223.65]KDO24080.1 hypothetical protein SPRG_10867 [Saprolegnia parasitica CBS 223.65]|eukprot:XP_012205216.1 hypothetical protein SPRG_10867 [Saprolegnia parasitica CBS 223.65]
MASPLAAVVHGLLAAGTCVLLYYALKYAKKYYFMVAFLLPPFVSFCMIYENIVRAATNLDGADASDGGDFDKSLTSVQVMLALQACIIPFMLLICFEVTYLVHKNKSVNFCGISFESGHRANRNNFKTTFLRFAVWLVGLSLLLINLYVYYSYFQDIEFHEGSYFINGDGTVATVLTQIPAYVLVILSLYMGLRLWNYGCNYAFVIHATCFNPWIWMVVGAIALAVGYIIPGMVFAITSNIGEFIMLAAIIRMFKEVHHDLQVADEFGRTMDRSLPSAMIVVPRDNMANSHATISTPISSYAPMTSPPSTAAAVSDDDDSDGARLTDANTNAYFSSILARTKGDQLRWDAPPSSIALEPVRLRKPQLASPPSDHNTVLRAPEPVLEFNASFPPVLEADDKDAWVILADETTTSTPPPRPAFDASAWAMDPPRSRRDSYTVSESRTANEEGARRRRRGRSVVSDVPTESSETPLRGATPATTSCCETPPNRHEDDDMDMDMDVDWMRQLGASLDFGDDAAALDDIPLGTPPPIVMATTQAAKRKADALLLGKATTADRDMDRLHQRDVTLCNEFGWTKLTTTGAFCTICSRIVVPRGSGFREYFYHEETAMHKKNLAATGDLSRAMEDEHSTSTRRSSRLKDKPLLPPMIDMDSSADEAAPKTRRSTSASTITTNTTTTMAKAHSKPELMVYDDSSDDSDSAPAATNAKVLMTPPLAPRATADESPSQLRLLTLKKAALSSATKAPKKTPTKMFKPTPTKSTKPTPTKPAKPTKPSSNQVNHVEEDVRPSQSKKVLREKKAGPKPKLTKPASANEDSSEADEPMEQQHRVNHVEEDVQSAPEESTKDGPRETEPGLDSPAAQVTASEGHPEPDDVASSPIAAAMTTIPCTEEVHHTDDADEVNKSLARPKKIRKLNTGLRSPPLTMLQYDTPATTSEDTSGDDEHALEVAPMPSPTPTEMAMPPPPSACLTCMARCDADESVQRVLSALHKQTSALQEQLDSIRMLLQLAMSQHNASHHV